MEEMKGDAPFGVVKISDEVVSVLASIATEEIDGVLVLPVGVSSNISHILKGKKTNISKNVKVVLSEDKAIIDLVVAIEYGVKITKVISLVQENVKRTVEAMTGIKVDTINVNVQNIYVPKQELEPIKND